MNEQVIYTDQNVSVSPSRVVLFGTTYATANITSVRVGEVNQGGCIIFIGLALIVGGLIAFGNSSPGGGIFALLLGGACFYWFTKMKEYTIVFHTSSGEIRAYSSRNGPYIFGVVEAINQAIISRG